MNVADNLPQLSLPDPSLEDCVEDESAKEVLDDSVINFTVELELVGVED